MRGLLTVIRWDIALELRRPVATLNMAVFALILLFVGSYAVSEKTEIHDVFGPIYFWMVILLAGTVGLSRAFLVEQQNGALSGTLVSPLDPGLFYLAKVVATWLYVMAMALFVLVTYGIFFDSGHWANIGPILAVMASFALVYVGAGLVLAALTTSISGGEVILRLLLFPLMIPSIIIVLMSGRGTFWERPERAAGLGPWECAAALTAMAVIYVTSGYLLFPKVVEE